jgi:hypothetical protein
VRRGTDARSREIAAAIGALDPAFASAYGVVRGAFAAMGIAEEEIERARSKIERHFLPNFDRIDALFLSLMPPPLIDAVALPALYRVFCRERIEHAWKCATEPPFTQPERWPVTDAEVIVLLREMSLRAPLIDVAGGLYWELFARRFPEAAAKIEGEGGGGSPFHGRENRPDVGRARDELDMILRRKIARVG